MPYKLIKYILVYFLLVFISPICFAQVPQLPSKVEINGRQLLVSRRLPDGSLDQAKPYVIKGITWAAASIAPTLRENPLNPAQKIEYGFFYDWQGRVPQGHDILAYWKRIQSFEYYKKDIPLIKECNINTIRVYLDFGTDPVKYNEILDECYNNSIMVIMAVANSKEDLDKQAYLDIVTLYKDHPAILMWCLGNEWNLNNYFDENATIATLTTLTDNAALKIKALDPNHPVSSGLGDDNKVNYIVKNAPNIDAWGMNVYRGDSFGSLFYNWQLMSAKPLFISEFGIDSFSTTGYSANSGQSWIAVDCFGAEKEETQALYFVRLWLEIKNNLSTVDDDMVCLGGCVHEFNDEIWKVGSYHSGLGGIYDPNLYEEDYKYYNKEGFIQYSFPDQVSNEEYFGIVDSTRNKKKKIFFEITNYFKS